MKLAESYDARQDMSNLSGHFKGDDNCRDRMSDASSERHRSYYGITTWQNGITTDSIRKTDDEHLAYKTTHSRAYISQQHTTPTIQPLFYLAEHLNEQDSVSVEANASGGGSLISEIPSVAKINRNVLSKFLLHA